MTDELGRPLHAEGRCLNGLGLFLNPNLYTVNCLTEWTFDGYRRLRRGPRQLERGRHPPSSCAPRRDTREGRTMTTSEEPRQRRNARRPRRATTRCCGPSSRSGCGERLPGATISELVVPAEQRHVLGDRAVRRHACPARTSRGGWSPASPRTRRPTRSSPLRHGAAVPDHGDGGRAHRRPGAHRAWLETDTDAIGVPFFVMERVEGIVPPDVMPYTFGDNWFFDAAARGPGSAWSATPSRSWPRCTSCRPRPGAVPGGPDESRATSGATSTSSATTTSGWPADGISSPLIERGFEWLEEHWPADEGRRRLQLGRRPHRQHDVRGLLAGGRPRLGDGLDRASRDRPRAG